MPLFWFSDCALVPVVSVALISFTGLDLLFLVLVATFFGVLTVKGAVINLYAEASKPSFCGAASGVLVTSVCSEKASSLI